MPFQRMYSVSFDNVAVTVAQDLFDIAPADDKPVILHAIYLSQSTEIGDAMEEMLRVRLVRGFATVGSGGGTFTPVPVNEHYAAAGATARINDTTIAVVGAGTTEILHVETFNVRSGWIYMPTPEMRPVIKQTTTRLVVQLQAAPADSVSMSGTLYFEEI